jgi:CcmD family protein
VTTAEKWVTAVYIAVFVLVLVYVLIIALKLARLERELAELEQLARARRAEEPETRTAVVQRPVRAGGPVEGTEARARG